MKKKIANSFMALTVVLSIFGGVSATASPADTKKEELLFEAPQINDVDVLFERAKKGITDTTDNIPKPELTITKLPNIRPQIKTDDDFNFDNIEYYTTVQKIKAVQNDDSVTETFSESTFAVASAGNKYETADDPSLGVVAYATINYDKTTQSNVSYYKLTSVTGGWNPHDPTINLSNRRVKYGASGNSPEGGSYVDQISAMINPTVNAFGYAAPSSWYRVTPISFGVNTWVTLTRNTQSWELHLTNNL